jgi:hypothetical protein
MTASVPLQTDLTSIGRLMKKQLTLYAYGLVIFVLAVIARILIDFVVPERLPFITFFPAVFLAAYYLGRGPGLLVLVLSTLVGTAWTDPTGQSAITFYMASALLFLAVAGMIVFFRRVNGGSEEARQQDQQIGMITES